MAPEQLRRARDLDTRVDIWAMGVVLHELLAGRPPFEGDTLAELVTQVLEGRRTPLRELRPELSPGYDAIIARCLATDRESRYANVEALAAALRRPDAERATQDLATAAALATQRAPHPLTHAEHPSQTRALPASHPPGALPMGSVAPPALSAPSSMARTEGPSGTPRRGYGMWLGALALGLVAAGIAVAMYARRADERTPTLSSGASSVGASHEPAQGPSDATPAAQASATAKGPASTSIATSAAASTATVTPPATTSSTTPPHPVTKGASTAGAAGYTGAATATPGSGNPFDKLRIK
jgi:serine/threonine-protein kinase